MIGNGMPDPEELTAGGAPASGEIAAATTLGPVDLTVADLARWPAHAARGRVRLVGASDHLA